MQIPSALNSPPKNTKAFYIQIWLKPLPKFLKSLLIVTVFKNSKFSCLLEKFIQQVMKCMTLDLRCTWTDKTNPEWRYVLIYVCQPGWSPGYLFQAIYSQRSPLTLCPGLCCICRSPLHFPLLFCNFLPYNCPWCVL